MRSVLLSTYELGRQPFGLASAAAWLRRVGSEVELHDLSVCEFEPEMFDRADLIGVHVPMHTATRLAGPIIERARSARPDAHIVAFGLYAALNEEGLRAMGADSVVDGEFEERLVEIHDSLVAGTTLGSAPDRLRRQRFIVPERAGLPELDRYARLQRADEPARVVAYTEATRGCRHSCRHCPIVPVYRGRFVVVDPEVVHADVAAQVAAGARHVTFGDPDFFNGPAHAMRVVRRLHDEFPDVTYDVTIKVEHLARHADLIPELVATGCVLVTSAVESFDPEILERLDKGHDPADFERVLDRLHRVGLAINPTFVAFTPWTTADGYLSMLDRIGRLGLVGNVSPIQYAIRLLIPAGSLLLELPDVATLVGPFDDEALVHPWEHGDPRMDALQREVMSIVVEGDSDRGGVFEKVWAAARRLIDQDARWPIDPPLAESVPIATVPYLTEPWYC
jgi:radical SAM superfamily enzyme YgiQ (UPF0313 family)